MKDWYRKKVRSAVPRPEQTDEKLSAEEFKERGIRTVSLHYSQATEPEIRYTHVRAHIFSHTIHSEQELQSSSMRCLASLQYYHSKLTLSKLNSKHQWFDNTSCATETYLLRYF